MARLRYSHYFFFLLCCQSRRMTNGGFDLMVAGYETTKKRALNLVDGAAGRWCFLSSWMHLDLDKMAQVSQ